MLDFDARRCEMGRGTLQFKTRTRLIARVFVDGAVVYTDNGLRAVAPEVAGCDVLAQFLRKGFLRRRPDIHGFRPQMFAKSLVCHGVNLSV